MVDGMTLVFSLMSGELFYIYNDEVAALEEYNIPLKAKPSSSCKSCYGRMYTGFETKGKYYIPCQKCMRKYSNLPDGYKAKVASASYGPKPINNPEDMIIGEDKKDILDLITSTT